LTLTVSNDLERLTDVNGGLGGAEEIVTALNATTHQITRSTGAWAAGTLLDILLITKATGVLVAMYKATVTVAGETATYAAVGTILGAETTYAGATHSLFISGMKKLSATSASLGTNYVKEIVKVFDNAGTGGAERVFDTIKDSKLFGNAWDDPLEVSQVKVYHSGDTIYFSKGSSATALGTVQAEVVVKPGLYTEGTKNNAMDCPPEENGALRDSVVAEYIKATGGQVPSSFAQGAAVLQARIAAAQADRIKAMEIRGKAD
jgi:hypothetical protein